MKGQHVIVLPHKAIKGGKVRQYIKDYMDETRKKSHASAKQAALLLERGDTPEAKLTLGKDYHAHQPKGLVTVHGYLNRYYQHHGPKQDLTKLVTSITKSAAKFVRPAHLDVPIAKRFAFSLTPEMTKHFAKIGIDLDEALRFIVVSTLDRYRNNPLMCDGAELGYVVACHHDRGNAHAHTLLLLADDTGHRLQLANGSVVKLPDGTTRKVDILAGLTATANVVLRTLLAERAPRNNNPTPTLLDSIDILIHRAAADTVKAEQVPDEVARLRSLPPPQLVRTLSATYQRHVTAYNDTAKAATTPEGRETIDAAIAKTAELLNQWSQRERDTIDQLAKAAKAKVVKSQQAERLTAIAQGTKHLKVIAAYLLNQRAKLDTLRCAIHGRQPIPLNDWYRFAPTVTHLPDKELAKYFPARITRSKSPTVIPAEPPLALTPPLQTATHQVQSARVRQ